MNFYYIHPHYQFDMDCIEPDMELSYFVQANSAENAAHLACKIFSEDHEISVVVYHGITNAAVDDAADREDAKNILIVRTLPETISGSERVLNWGTLPQDAFRIKKI